MPIRPYSLALVSILATAAAYATPSGLNNIPTADTVPTKTFVLQAFSTVGGLADGDLNLGFKTGLDFDFVKFETGLAYHLYPNHSGPAAIHGKMAVPLGENLPTLAIGIANVSFNTYYRDKAGDEFSYAVATQAFGDLRIHAGCGYVDTESLPFAGLDYTFRKREQVPAASDGKAVADGKSFKAAQAMETKVTDLFTIRGDVIAQRDSSWMYSAGVLVPVTSWFVFETWANLPDNGDSPSWTIKGNFVISF